MKKKTNISKQLYAIRLSNFIFLGILLFSMIVSVGCGGGGSSDDTVNNEVPSGEELPTWYKDNDGDGYGNPRDTISAATQPNGYISDNSDCDDTDADLYHPEKWYKDANGDGYGNPDVYQTACRQPDGFVNGDTLYKIFNDPVDIQVSLKNSDEEGDFTPVVDGTYIGPGVQTIGIKVNPSQEGQRIFVSDGGDISKEATQNENEYYICNYEFNADKYKNYPLLIQVIYPDGYVSKKKHVLLTSDSFRAGPEALVERGLGITLGADLLDDLKIVIEKLFGDELEAEEIKIKDISPATNTNFLEAKNGVFHVEMEVPAGKFLDYLEKEDGENNALIKALIAFIEFFPGVPVPISADLVISDDTNAGKRELLLEFEDIKVIGLPIDPISLPVSPLYLDLGHLLNLMVEKDNSEDNVFGNFITNLNMNKTMFLNLNGLPDATTENYASIGASLFATDTNEDGRYIFPTVQEDSSQELMEMNRLKKGSDFNMGIGLSQYNLNQILNEMFKDVKVVFPAAELAGFSSAIPKLPEGDVQNIEISLDHAGIGFDMADQSTPDRIRLEITNIVFQYLEKDTAKWNLSLDIILEIFISVRSEGNESFLDLEMTPIPELCHTHTMKDTIGIGIFDNPTFVATLFKILNEEPGDQNGDSFIFSIPLSNLGFTSSNIDSDPVAIEYDGKGNCFMNLVVDSIGIVDSLNLVPVKD